MERYDAVVVGAGPNGLSAGVALARAGRSVVVIEAADRVGGGTRTEELTLPGFQHDVCSAVHPFAMGSPFFRRLPLEAHGLRWVQPELPLAHGIDPETIVPLPRDVDEAAERLGPEYTRRMRPMVSNWPALEEHLFGPLIRPPSHPIALGRFGIAALRSASTTSKALGPVAGPLFAGCAAHAFLPLERPLTASFGWVLMSGAHVFGWPFAAGGSRAIADALAAYLVELGGDIRTGQEVGDIAELPRSDLIFFDVTPTVFARIASRRLPSSYLRKTEKYQFGPAAYKIDYALSDRVPWLHPDLARAGTIHLSGTSQEVAQAERAAFRGTGYPQPFILVAQPSIVDPTRAPGNGHTLWVYAHVPNGSTMDHSTQIERRLEAFAPGFSNLVLERHIMAPSDLEARNPNYQGGDITGGAHTLRQLIFRPFPQANPYATPLENVYLCSASTPPGAGAHGMCGFHAVESAIGRDADSG